METPLARSSLDAEPRRRLAFSERAAASREQREWPAYVTPGWYAVALASDVRPGQLASRTVAGRQLVLARTNSGKPLVLDRYCAHQGASLAAGKVVGESVQCPFHHWEYDAAGTCVNIPNCSKRPKGARVAGHPTLERFGLIWTFVGAPENATKHPLPEAAEFHAGAGYRLFRAKRTAIVGTSPRDITENVVDQGHVRAVHHVNESPKSIEFEFSSGRFHSDFRVSVRGKVLSGYTTLYAPAFWWTGLRGFRQLGSPVDATTWLYALGPAGPETTECYSVCYTTGSRWNPIHRAVGEVMERLWSRGFNQDVEVWRDKVVRERPLLCSIDTGPIVEFRRWWASYDAEMRQVAEGGAA